MTSSASDWIGSIAVGKNADLIVATGDPSNDISAIENVEAVFFDVAVSRRQLSAAIKDVPL